MSKERARLSLDLKPEIDLSQFKPRPTKTYDNHKDVKAGDSVAADHGFTSREREPKDIKRRSHKRPPAFDSLLSIRAYQTDVDSFHNLANSKGWKSGKLLAELLKAYTGQ